MRKTIMARALLSALLALSLTAAACSAESEPVDPSGVVFGDGELPDSVPSDFPIPSTAVIGQTLVDAANSRTEVVVRIGSPIDSVARFYDVNLVNQGYVITSSTGDSAGWVVEFQRDGLQGSVTIIKADTSISQYSVVLIGS